MSDVLTPPRLPRGETSVTTTSTASCVTGCTVRGEHVTDCPRVDADGRECRGCLPRPASFGLLCSWCWQRLHGDVVDAPGLVEHLRAEAEPDAGAAPPSDTRAYRSPAEGSVLSAAVDAADEVHACLAVWVQEIVDKHPGHLVDGDGGAPTLRRLTGPSQAEWWRSQTTTRVDHETGELYLSRSRVVGLHSAAATAELVRWLLPHLPWVAQQDWAGVMRSELAHLIGTTKARWPMEERSRPVLHAACTECGRASLVYHPPAFPGAQVQVACSHPECGEVYDERAWAGLVREIEDARRAELARIKTEQREAGA